ncbi:MAG TPA: tRNA pseudouridine(38-40) synthase TruA [Bryobacteraceae bacterium]|jgi:tRNA pseudouridine38-40 synthase|nr:tRNA pseudouridine(38-40) synthase TruA [Bryobacteraceae bacterium]
MVKRRLRFDVAYDGTEFHGWQVQPGLPTIQGTLEEVISTIEGKPVQVAASGRTDAGVHALAQVAAVTIENPIPASNFRRAVNRLLPKDIRIDNVRETELTFHPRFDAIRKIYEYRIFREEICPPFSRRYVYHHPFPLDEETMIRAARLLKGEHDFCAFAAADEKYASGQSMVRIIYHSELRRDRDMLIYRVTGSGFLKHMVRNIVGVLLQVGRGNLTPCDVTGRLSPNCVIPPGPTAPPSGLFLVSVEYGPSTTLASAFSSTREPY